jgi:hypothetical protein
MQQSSQGLDAAEPHLRQQDSDVAAAVAAERRLQVLHDAGVALQPPRSVTVTHCYDVQEDLLPQTYQTQAPQAHGLVKVSHERQLLPTCRPRVPSTMPHCRAGAAASTARRRAARMPSWSYRSAVISRAYGSYLHMTAPVRIYPQQKAVQAAVSCIADSLCMLCVSLNVRGYRGART